jgi:hypothetical protein
MQAPDPLRLFLHVGLHKTGTTSIQMRFFNNAEVLRRKGFLYPLGRFDRFHSQHSAIADLTAPDRHDDLISLLRGVWREAKESGCHSVVLSGERLSTLPDAQLATLRDALAETGFDATVLAFFRAYSDYVRSVVAASMLAAEYATPARLAARVKRYDPQKAAEKLIRVFGADKVICHDLSDGDDSVILFDRYIGLNAEIEHARANAAFDFPTRSWVNAIRPDLHITTTRMQRIYDEIFGVQRFPASAEADFLAEVAQAIRRGRGSPPPQLDELLAAPASPASRSETVLYLKQFERFVAALRREAQGRRSLGWARRKVRERLLRLRAAWLNR